MLAFHFPPFAQSSGSIRTLSFVRQLPNHHWQPVVLTARPHAYPEVDDRSLSLVPYGARVIRAVGLDVGRHVAIAGRYPSGLRRPTAGIRGPRRRSLPDSRSSDAMELRFFGPLFRLRAPCSLPWHCIDSPRFR